MKKSTRVIIILIISVVYSIGFLSMANIYKPDWSLEWVEFIVYQQITFWMLLLMDYLRLKLVEGINNF